MNVVPSGFRTFACEHGYWQRDGQQSLNQVSTIMETSNNLNFETSEINAQTREVGYDLVIPSPAQK